MPSRILSYLKIVKGLTPFKKISPNFSIIGNYIVSSHKFELLYTNRYVMKKYRPLLLILLLFVAFAGYAQEGKQYFTHIVKKGETLYSLSQMYGTTVEAIQKANPGKTKVLKINQQLRIPQTTTLVPEGKDGKGIWKGDLFHTIKAKETLYSLSKEYGIDYIEICNANPGLSPTNFRIGEVIVIPLSKVSENAKKEESLPVTESEIAVVSRYKASKGETIDEICAAHGVLKEDFVRVNPHLKSTEIRKKTIVNIPEKRSKAGISPKEETALSNAEVFDRFAEYKDSLLEAKSHLDDGKTRVAVILPFMLDKYSPNEQARMVEFYEGFLMAVYRLKQEGYSFEINTFDSGSKTDSLDELIKSGSLDNMDMIIGAYFVNHNKELAAFAKEKEIPLVIPFSNKEDEIFKNPMVYTVNAMQSYLLPEVAENFVAMFPDANIIFVEDENKSIKEEFIEVMTDEFSKHSIPYTTTNIKTLDEGAVKELKRLSKPGRRNIIIPKSSSAASMTELAAILSNAHYENPDFMSNCTLFGYPEWQKHAPMAKDQLYLIDTYFYTNLYTHFSFKESMEFQDEFIRWYNRPLNEIIPRYGMMGYDIGYYFLYAINEFGNEFPDRINDIEFSPLQSGFKFSRVNNWGGMVNKKVFFIHYNNDFTITKIDLDKCKEEETEKTEETMLESIF